MVREQPQERNLGIDMLRATAILMVFFSHGVTLKGIPILQEFGTGVDLFFLISGFLIGRIYFRSRQIGTFSTLAFWESRWWRTLPPYFVALGMYAVASRWDAAHAVNWRYIFFIQNFKGMGGFAPSWSLCEEEHFYFLLPLLMLAAERWLGKARLLWMLPMAFFLPLALRVGVMARLGQMPAQWYWMTHFHSEALIAGVWLAFVQVQKPALFKRLKWPSRLALGVAPAILFALSELKQRNDWGSIFVFTILAIAYLAWFRVMHDLTWRPCTRAGELMREGLKFVAVSSYSVYLVHVLFLDNVRRVIDGWPRGVMKSSVILVVTYALCIGFYFTVERTTLLAREAYMARRKRPAFAGSGVADDVVTA